jgi:galactokinase
MCASADRDARAAMPSRVTKHVRSAAKAFAERVGRLPTLAAFAPGRVNLIGEHTDYNQGFALPIAIERQTVVVADRAATSRGALHMPDVGEICTVDFSSTLAPQPDRHANYLLGVVDQFSKRGIVPPALDVLVTGNLPPGAGLGSSAALEVAFALVIAHETRTPLEIWDIARLCQAAEHEFAGTPCGMMDMLVSVAARPEQAMLIDCRDQRLHMTSADFDSLGATMLIVDTGTRHALRDGGGSPYADRRAACAAVAATLGRASLREVTIEELDGHGLTNIQRRRALHVISENTRVLLAAEALALGDLPRLGELMLAGHASLRDLYEVSCPELDALVAEADDMRRRRQGVFGARMTGAGFGGCVIILCQAARAHEVMQALQTSFQARFGRPPAAMFATSAVGGAAVTPLAEEWLR